MPPTGLTTRRTLLLGLVTFLLMLPETLPVPVLRGLVLERFSVSDALTSWFMAANMVGALIAAPVVGLWGDRFGRRRLCLLATCIDALLMQAMAHPTGFATFLLLRVAEGAVHITALTLVMSLTADAAGSRRGRALGSLGAGLTLGVATGAAIGGVLGHDDPLRTLHAASLVLLAAAGLAAAVLPHHPPAAMRPRRGELLRALRDQAGLRLPLLLAAFDRFTVGFFTTGFPLLLAGLHGVDRPRIGMLLGAFLFPFALLSYPIGRLAERRRVRPMIVGGSLVYGLGVVLVPLLPVPLLWGLMPLLGTASAVMFVPTLLWLLDRAHGVGRTTAMASFHAAGALGFLLGPLCCGGLIALGGAGMRGYVLAFAFAGATEITGALLVWRAAPAQAFGPKPPPG